MCEVDAALQFMGYSHILKQFSAKPKVICMEKFK
jgi:hypothetical protein